MPTGDGVDGGPVNELHAMTARPLPGQWTALHLVVEDKPGGARATVTIDGTVAVDTTTALRARINRG